MRGQKVVDNHFPFTYKNDDMKKMLQAAALILLAVSVVYAAAHSHSGTESCSNEWEAMEKPAGLASKTGR